MKRNKFMKVYEFKCGNCGSRKYEKENEHIYKCVYCGYQEEVYLQEKNNTDELEANQQALEQQIDELREELEERNERIDRSTIIELIVTIVFGQAGIHRFMKGKIITGLLYLFTGGLFGLGWLGDIIKCASRLSSGDRRDRR